MSLLKDEAPVRTGRLRKGLTYKTSDSGKATKLVLYSAAPYTDLVLRGRGPVEAKHAKALRFEPGPPGSGFIFRKRVGPAKANDFVGRVVGRAGGEMQAAARRMAAQVAAAWSG